MFSSSAKLCEEKDFLAASLEQGKQQRRKVQHSESKHKGPKPVCPKELFQVCIPETTERGSAGTPSQAGHLWKVPILRREAGAQMAPCPALRFGWLWMASSIAWWPSVSLSSSTDPSLWTWGVGWVPAPGCLCKAGAAEERGPDTCLIHPTPLLDLLLFSEPRRK